MKRPRFRLRTLLVLTVPPALALLLAIPVRKARSAAWESVCECNFCYIATALLNFRDRHGHFPDDESVQSSTRPRQSWRVYLYRDEYYDETFNASYKFDLPWDHPKNLPFSRQCPNGFFCPNNQSEPARFTNYVAVIGLDGVSSLDHATAIPKDSPEAARHIMVIEYPNSDILWTEPRDLDLSDLDKLTPGADEHGLGVLFADAHFERLPLPELRRRLTSPPLPAQASP